MFEYFTSFKPPISNDTERTQISYVLTNIDLNRDQGRSKEYCKMFYPNPVGHTFTSVLSYSLRPLLWATSGSAESIEISTVGCLDTI